MTGRHSSIPTAETDNGGKRKPPKKSSDTVDAESQNDETSGES
jgi:hypothetical protein